MSYTLILGNKNYSSWSMRAWLLLKFLDVPFEEVSINLYTETSRGEVMSLGGQTGKVPVLRTTDVTMWDTLAIAEFLYEYYPQVWPQSVQARALARSFCAEMHSSFMDLREAMPMNTRGRNRKAPISLGIESDIQRIKEIWEYCVSHFPGPWLFGDYGAVDCFFAPVATRFQTYDVSLTGVAREYQEKILAHPHVIEWMEQGLKENTIIEISELPLKA